MRFKKEEDPSSRIPKGKQRFLEDGKTRSGTNELVGEQGSGSDCVVYRYRQWFATKPEKKTGTYHFVKDFFTQIFSLGSRRYAEEVWYEWQEWYIEWSENSCDPGARFDEYTSDRQTRKEVVQEEGVTSVPFPEDYRPSVTIGGRIEIGHTQTPAPQTGGDPGKKTPSSGEPVKTGPADPAPIEPATVKDFDLGSWSPETIAFEGYGNTEIDYSSNAKEWTPALVRTNSWGSHEYTPLYIGQTYTRDEISRFRSPYNGITGDISFGDLNSDRYVYLGANFYTYFGDFYRIESRDGGYIEYVVSYGYYLALISPYHE